MQAECANFYKRYISNGFGCRVAGHQRRADASLPCCCFCRCCWWLLMMWRWMKIGKKSIVISWA